MSDAKQLFDKIEQVLKRLVPNLPEVHWPTVGAVTNNYAFYANRLIKELARFESVARKYLNDFDPRRSIAKHPITKEELLFLDKSVGELEASSLPTKEQSEFLGAFKFIYDRVDRVISKRTFPNINWPDGAKDNESMVKLVQELSLYQQCADEFRRELYNALSAHDAWLERAHKNEPVLMRCLVVRLLNSCVVLIRNALHT